MTVTAMERYFRPLPCAPDRAGARPLAGGWCGFAEIEALSRDEAPQVVPADAVVSLYPEAGEVFERLVRLRAPLCGTPLDRPLLMGVVNVTPDSFSDGGFLEDAYAAVRHGLALTEAGADLLDIGGESTRPGADPVPLERELERVLPVIKGLREAGCTTPISIDTRKAGVAAAALDAGASLFNDVSALSYDPASPDIATRAGAICLMHAQGDPRTMQDDPRYDDVLLEVYDHLAERVALAEMAGIPRARIIVDPGIGFGKTIEHNLALLRGLSLFHGLGCPIMLGVSRKGFIGRLSGETDAAKRAPGSIAAALAGLEQGVQILRVHDVAEHAQAIAIWKSIRDAEGETTR